MKKIFLYILLFNILNGNINTSEINKSILISTNNTKRYPVFTKNFDNFDKKIFANPTVITNENSSNSFSIADPMIILDTNDIKGTIKLPRNLSCITTVPSDLDFYIFDFIDASNLCFENFIKSFFCIFNEKNNLFIIKKAICLKNNLFNQTDKSSELMTIENLYIEVRFNEISRILFDIANNSFKILFSGESNCLRLQTISNDLKEKEQKRLLREYLLTKNPD